MKDNGKSRILILLILMLLLFLFLIRQLFVLQIVNGKKYAENYQLKITKTLIRKGARGTIYDRSGNVLASNRLVYTITMTDDGRYDTDRRQQLTLNSSIYRLGKKLQKNGESLCHDLKIAVRADGTYEYTAEGAARLRFLADVFGKANPDELSKEQSVVSAPDLIAYLSSDDRFGLYGTKEGRYTDSELEEYGLPKTYTKEEILDITGVRYMLSLYAYRKYQAVTIARNISPETMAYVLENQADFAGIEVEEDWERVYEGGEAFAHVLGYTGTISPEELEEKGTEYSIDSVVGKSGLEQYFETELRGTDGEKTVLVDHVGRILGEGGTQREPAAGHDVFLSIDKDLQMAVYQILEQTLAGVLSGNLINEKYFDKTKVSDTSEIRIPLFDVYTALIENNGIDIGRMKQETASGLEREILEKIFHRKETVKAQLLSEFTDTPHVSETLSDEMRECISVLLQESGLFREEAEEETELTNVSPKEFLSEAIKKGQIDSELLDPKTKYTTEEESYDLAVDYLLNYFEESAAVEKILLKYLVLEEELSQQDFCRLLYEQEILAKDGDYEALLSGELTPYSWIKKKINAIELTPAQLALDPCSASAVVVEADTGKILACVTYPGYDNNRLANQTDSAYYSRLLQDKSLPLYNRATRQLTAPGSTLKPVTVIAGLQEGVIAPDSSVVCDGVFDAVYPPLRCWKHTGHGEIENAAAAIQNSCNDYLCEISYRLGQQGTGVYDDGQALACLQKYAALFDLDQKSGAELAESSPHVTEQYGIPSAIGQGTHNYTTIQLARYMNTLASRGSSFQLSMVKEIRDKNGTVSEVPPALQSTVELDETIWDTVWQGMLWFAQNNNVLKDMKIHVAGKTGTAQESKLRPDHSLFVGCAPAEKPEISLAVRIANGYGSSNATYAGKNILNYYFGTESKEEILTGEASEASNSRSD